jgi:hypothetical protein
VIHWVLLPFVLWDFTRAICYVKSPVRYIVSYRFSGTDVHQIMATVMRCRVDVSPEHLGVNSKLTLTDASDTVPYSAVVDILKTAPDLVSPVIKLDTVSKYC